MLRIVLLVDPTVESIYANFCECLPILCLVIDPQLGICVSRCMCSSSV